MAKLNLVVENRVAECCTLRDRTVIGRSKQAEVLLPDPAASREHAVIRRDGLRWLIEDLRSANGIEVNGRPTTQAVLAEGDIIRIGDSLLIFTFDETPPEADRVVVVGADGALPADGWADARDVAFRTPATTEAIEAVGDAASNLCGRSCLAEPEARYHSLAGLEALGNGFRHGARKDPGQVVECRVVRDPRRVLFRVRDPGPGFDYRQALKVAHEGDALGVARARFKSGRPGGLGIMMMVRCVDLVEFNDSGSEITLTKCPGEVFGRDTIYAGLGFKPEEPPPLA